MPDLLNELYYLKIYSWANESLNIELEKIEKEEVAEKEEEHIQKKKK